MEKQRKQIHLLCHFSNNIGFQTPWLVLSHVEIANCIVPWLLILVSYIGKVQKRKFQYSPHDSCFRDWLTDSLLRVSFGCLCNDSLACRLENHDQKPNRYLHFGEAEFGSRLVLDFLLGRCVPTNYPIRKSLVCNLANTISLPTAR